MFKRSLFLLGTALCFGTVGSLSASYYSKVIEEFKQNDFAQVLKSELFPDLGNENGFYPKFCLELSYILQASHYSRPVDEVVGLAMDEVNGLEFNGQGSPAWSRFIDPQQARKVQQKLADNQELTSDESALLLDMNKKKQQKEKFIPAVTRAVYNYYLTNPEEFKECTNLHYYVVEHHRQSAIQLEQQVQHTSPERQKKILSDYEHSLADSHREIRDLENQLHQVQLVNEKLTKAREDKFNNEEYPFLQELIISNNELKSEVAHLKNDLSSQERQFKELDAAFQKEKDTYRQFMAGTPFGKVNEELTATYKKSLQETDRLNQELAQKIQALQAVQQEVLDTQQDMKTFMTRQDKVMQDAQESATAAAQFSNETRLKNNNLNFRNKNLWNENTFFKEKYDKEVDANKSLQQNLQDQTDLNKKQEEQLKALQAQLENEKKVSEEESQKRLEQMKLEYQQQIEDQINEIKMLTIDNKELRSQCEMQQQEIQNKDNEIDDLQRRIDSILEEVRQSQNDQQQDNQ